MQALLTRISSLTVQDLKGMLPGLLSAVLVTTTSLAIRASHGVRAFPSVDDFAYLPLARRFLNHDLFPHDLFITSSILHAPAWAAVVWVSDKTVGLVSGFYAIVLVLSFFTVLAVWRLLRILGGSGTLLPIAAILAFSNRHPGLGRGLHDGAFGDGFHTQWLAICFMLWLYVAWLEKRPVLAGVFLGLSTAAHPVVGVHAAVVLVIAAIVALVDFSALLVPFFVAGIMAAPVLVPIVFGLSQSPGEQPWAPAALIEKGYLFRTSHEFSLELTSPAAGMTLVLLFILGLVGAILLTQLRTVRRVPEMAGLLGGHAVLAALFLVFHAGLLPESWRHLTIVPYLLHLSRTTPVLVVLASVLSVAALEAMFETVNPRTPFLTGLRIAFLMGLGFLLSVYVEWSGFLLALLAVAGLWMVFGRAERAKLPILAALLVVGAMAAFSVKGQSGQEREVSPADRELFEWVNGKSAQDDLFIVPVGFEEFRTYTNRGVFVDFKVFPASSPFLVPEWRRRVDLVSAPDEIALRHQGWPVVEQLARTYAQANSTGRIAELLLETEADFFVFDKRGEEIPPFLPRHTESSDELEIVFQNSRYRVYRRRTES